MRLPVALQLYSVRDDASKNLKDVLKQVKEMGYDGVEFAGLYGHSANDVRAMLDEIGLVGISAHVAPAELLTDIEGKISDYATVGCKYIAVPYLGENDRPGAANWPAIADAIRKISAVAKTKGITILYHNHDFEFVKKDGEYLLDLMYEELPADILQTELDTCWVNVGGEDPVKYILKYTGRAPVVHLKDFVINGEQKGSLYKLIGIDDEEEADNAEEGFAFRPVGYGCQDFGAILEASDKAGAEWVVVEQDEATMGKTPLESAEMSRNYLKDNFGI